MIGQMLCKQEFYRGDDWADAVYHRVCSANFRTMKQIPAIHEHEDSSLKKLKVGRRPEKQRADAFLEVARFLEENDGCVSLKSCFPIIISTFIPIITIIITRFIAYIQFEKIIKKI